MAYSYVRYEGDGFNTSFAFAFPYIDQSHVKVRVNGVLTSYTWLSDYTVSISPAPAIGAAVEVRRETPKETAPVDFIDGSVLLESQLDLITNFNLYSAQEAFDVAEGSLTEDSTNNFNAENKRITNVAAPVNDGDAVNKQTLVYEYPVILEVADNFTPINVVAADLGSARLYETDLGLITDTPTSEPLAVGSIETVANNISDVQSVVDNLPSILDADTNAATATTQAGIATTQAGIATTQAGIATTQAGIATTKAGEAATSATNASNSASSSATSAANALTSENNAEAAELSANDWATKTSGPVAGGEYSAKYHAQQAVTSADNALSSANSAAAAQVAAEAARDSTLTAYDNFDDRYLGAKSSDPTVDNDGNALVAGALYFSTSLEYMRVYTGSLWVDAYAAGTSFLAKANNLSDLTNTATARSNLGLATVASTGAYSDLTGKPTLGTLAAKNTVESADLAATLDLGTI